MPTYGFKIAAEDSSIATMLKIQQQMEAMGIKSKIVTKEVEEHFSEMGSKLKETFSELKTVIAGSLFAGGVFGGYEFLKASKEAYEDLEKSVTKVNTVLASTKFAAGLSGNAIEEQAKELSTKIINSRSEIMDAQGMLLSFTGVKGGTFDRATKDVADFATFYKEDMTAAALQVGKALNDPEHGMSRLMRQGVAFTEEQKKQVKLYQEHGRLAEAQAVILKELETEFGGQAQAFALTDEGKVDMAKKSWSSLKLEIGEIISKLEVSLIPAFDDVVKEIKAAFESAPLQFFISHLADLVSLTLRAIPIWAGYKAAMLAVDGATALSNISLTALGISFGTTEVAAEGATAAVEGFAVAWSSVGIGALVVGIGLLVEHLISMNQQLDDAIDKKYKLSETQDFVNNNEKQFQSINERFSVLNSLGTKSKEELFGDLKSQSEEAQKELKEHLMPRLAKVKADYEKAFRIVGHYEGYDGSGQRATINKYAENDPAKMNAIKSAYDQQLNSVHAVSNRISAFADGFKKLKEAGITHGLTTGRSAIKDNATNTSDLAGAKGGLGEAKVINIHIDTMQKVAVANGEGWKNSSQNAIELLIRTLNNMAYSQSSSF